MGWIELLKTHSMTHTSVGYCGLVWVQPTPFRRVARAVLVAENVGLTVILSTL
jgi:hypothetical protein